MWFDRPGRNPLAGHDPAVWKTKDWKYPKGNAANISKGNDMIIRKHWTVPIVLLLMATALLAVACASEAASGSAGEDGPAISEQNTQHSEEEAESAESHEEEGEGHQAQETGGAGHEQEEASSHEEEGDGHGHAKEEAEHGHGGETTLIEDAPEITLRTTEWDFQPATLRLTKGEPVTIVLDNDGAIEHEVELPGLHLHAQAGETVKGSFVPDEIGTFDFACEIPGHREAGMVGSLVVEPAVQHEDEAADDHEGSA